MDKMTSKMAVCKEKARRILRILTKSIYFRVPLLLLTRAGLLPAWVWKRLPIEKRFRVRLPGGKSFLYSSVLNDGIGRALYWKGLKGWERETTGVFCRLARKSRIIIDIGANTGLYSLLACASNEEVKVISFEPVERVRNRLIENMELNNWRNRCRVRGEAVTNFVGRTEMHIPYGDLPVSASFNRDGFRGLSGELVEIAATSIDAVLSKEEKVDLVKIDVEGFEDQVLIGMNNTLEASKPVLIMEIIPGGPAEEIECILSSLGYSYYHLSKHGLLPVQTIMPDRNERCKNFLFTVDKI